MCFVCVNVYEARSGCGIIIGYYIKYPYDYIVYENNTSLIYIHVLHQRKLGLYSIIFIHSNCKRPWALEI